MESAVIVRVALPKALDDLRLRCVSDARRGVPAHVTLLYPFVEPDALTPDVHQMIASIAAANSSFSFALSGPKRWPDTIYAAVDPNEPFLALHRQLTSAFPGYPIYGRPGFQLVPHVTLAEGECVSDGAIWADPSWSALPIQRSVAAVEVIAEGDGGRWRTVWTLPLADTGV